MTARILIDADPGTDDALALMMALNSPSLEVAGICTVGGNATLAHTTRNTLRLLDYLGRSEIPVHRGAARPLRGSFSYAYNFHGPAGLTVRLPSPKSGPAPVRAPDFIVGQARSSPGELTLMALGPLTNVARALTMEPRLSEWVKEIVVMGGAVHVPGNVTPAAEFNFYNDPHAADIVLSSGAPITLVGLDVCDRVSVARPDVEWYSGDSPSRRLAGRILASWFDFRGGDDRYALCDPLAMVAAVEPDVFTFRRAWVTVNTQSGSRLGKTTTAYGQGSVDVATDVDVTRAKEVIRDLL